MIEVPLGGQRVSGAVTLVDDEDEWITVYSWSLSTRGYVQGRVSRGCYSSEEEESRVATEWRENHYKARRAAG